MSRPSLHTDIPLQFLQAPSFNGSAGEKIAYKHNDGDGPTVVWCGGLRSDMEGGKATHIQDWALARGQAYIRFDYFGHGESSGNFEHGTISRWSDDTVHVLEALTDGPVVLVGSSMGGWAALNVAMTRPDKVAGLILIAPAPDFTQKLMWAGFSDDIRRTITEDGVYYEPSDYGDPMPISHVLIHDGQTRQILDAPIPFSGPVRILQGMQDPDVPFTHAAKIVDALTSDDVELTLVKSGDHRLSTPRDLARLTETTEALLNTLERSM